MSCFHSLISCVVYADACFPTKKCNSVGTTTCKCHKAVDTTSAIQGAPETTSAAAATPSPTSSPPASSGLGSGSSGAGGVTPKKFRIGTCNNPQPPYVFYNVSSPLSVRGFEYDVLKTVWPLVYTEAVLGKDEDAVALIGDYTNNLPPFGLYSRLDLVQAIKAGEVDIGFCGLAIMPESMDDLAFMPAHTFSGLRCLVQKGKEADFHFVIDTLFASFRDTFTQSVLLFMLLFSVIFAHVIWVLERTKRGHFNCDYGPGIIDGLWYAIVTAFTVGYGDKVAKTLLGRIASCAWMVVGTLFLATFTAALSARLVSRANDDPTSSVNINAPEDLSEWRVGTPSQIISDELESLVPGLLMSNYGSVLACVAALLRGEIDIAGL
jgi:hypothetical protein